MSRLSRITTAVAIAVGSAGFSASADAEVGTLLMDGQEYALEELVIEARSGGGLVVTVSTSGEGAPPPEEPPPEEPPPEEPPPEEPPPEEPPPPGCDVPDTVTMMNRAWPVGVRETMEIRTNQILSFDMRYTTATATGAYETVPTSSNNAGRETWVSLCPGGEPISRRCESAGLELTTVQWAIPEIRATCRIQRGVQYYFNVRGSSSSTFYATGAVSQ